MLHSQVYHGELLVICDETSGLKQWADKAQYCSIWAQMVCF